MALLCRASRLRHLAAQTVANSGPTTGVARVFANGVMDWNTFQFKPPAQVTLHHLGQYDTNSNWVASNHGLLTGKYVQVTVESLNQFDPTDFGYLSNVPDLYFSDVNTKEILSSPPNEIQMQCHWPHCRPFAH